MPARFSLCNWAAADRAALKSRQSVSNRSPAMSRKSTCSSRQICTRLSSAPARGQPQTLDGAHRHTLPAPQGAVEMNVGGMQKFYGVRGHPLRFVWSPRANKGNRASLARCHRHRIPEFRVLQGAVSNQTRARGGLNPWRGPTRGEDYGLALRSAFNRRIDHQASRTSAAANNTRKILALAGKAIAAKTRTIKARATRIQTSAVRPPNQE